MCRGRARPGEHGTLLLRAIGGSPPLPRPAPAKTPMPNVAPGGIPTADGPEAMLGHVPRHAQRARTGPWALACAGGESRSGAGDATGREAALRGMPRPHHASAKTGIHVSPGLIRPLRADRRRPVMLACDATSVEITDLAGWTFGPGLYRSIRISSGRAERTVLFCHALSQDDRSGDAAER